MTFNRIKSLLGAGGHAPNYLSGEFRTLEDISDPETWEDETKTDWKEFISKNKWPITVLALFGISLSAYFSYILIEVSTGIVQNIWFQRTAVLATTAGTAYFAGRSQQRNILRRLDWLVLMKDNGGVTFYLGYYREGNETEAPLFVPVKGFTLKGHRSKPYRVQEVSVELARKHKKRNGDEDDVAVIRLHPEYAVESKTDWGMVVGQLTNGLDLDVGNESNLQASRPENVADEDALQETKSAIRDLQQELQNAADDAQKYKRLYKQEKKDAQKRRDEIISDFVDDHRRVTEVHQRSYSQNDSSDGQVAPARQDDFSDIENQVTADDD